MTKPGIADVLPLSPLQEGMLFLALYDENAVDAYTAQLTFDLEGPLDPARLRAAGEALLRRYPNLGAGFRHEKLSRPVQVIPHQCELPWQEVDLAAMDAEEREAAFARVAETERTRRFDLSRPPLLRFTLARLAQDQYRLVLSFHHILLDGWSFPLVVNDLFELYARSGDETALPKVTPYRDYLAWLSRQDRDGAETAWRAALDGDVEPTLLAPADAANGVRVAPQEFTVELSEEVTANLNSLARARGWTMNTLVQGAWGLLLAAATGRSDVLFGATVSGRPAELPGVQSMVGLFINTIPVRVGFHHAESFAELFARIQEQQTDLMDHHHLGLTEIQRLAGHRALFDTLAVFENYPFDSGDLNKSVDGVRVSGFTGRDATHYPLSLIAYPGERMVLRVGHRPDLVDRTSAESLVARLVRIFEAVAADPQRSVASLDVLTDRERELVLSEWNDTRHPTRGRHEAGGATLPQLFEERAAQMPDRTAVVFEGQSLTYAELNSRANRLARHLIEQGAGPEQFVALAVPRSLDLIISLLAVEKAGAAYLPLDPDHPAERITYVIEESRPRLLLTNGATAETLPARRHPGARRRCPSEHRGARRVHGRRCDGLGPDGAAGRPAPGLRHLHLRFHRQAQGRGGPALRHRQPPRLDAGAVRAGGRRPGAAEDSGRLRRIGVGVLLAAAPVPARGRQARRAQGSGVPRRADTYRGVTTVHFVPSMLRAFLAESAAAGCTALRRVVCSGEARPPRCATSSSGCCRRGAAQPVRPDRGVGGRHLRGSAVRKTPRVWCRSAVQCGTSGSTCWIQRCVRWRRGSRVTSIWPVCSWRAAICTGRP